MAPLFALPASGMAQGGRVVSRNALARMQIGAGSEAYLDEDGRTGLFSWESTNRAAAVSADPEQGIFVAPAKDPSGASGAWVRVVSDNVIQVDWFGAAGDGVRNDFPALHAAVDLTRVERRFREIRFDGARRYLLEGFRKLGSVRLNFSDIVIDGRGAELKIEPMVRNTAVFVVGNERYATGVDESLPEKIVIRGFRVDFVQNAAFFKFISLRHPARGVTIEDNEAYQSRLGDNTPYAKGDCNLVNLFVIQSMAGGGARGNPQDRMARLHDVSIRRNKVRNRIQLTADAGRGVNGLTITDNEIFDPRANGIAVTGTGRLTMLDDVLISRNRIYRASGRGIFVQNDGISDIYNSDIAGISAYQCYARGVTITDNLLENCTEGIRTGTYIQGFHGLRIDNNIVRSNSRENGASAIRIQTNSYGWARQYHGGAGPVVRADDFDVLSGRINLRGHSLCEACGVRIKPVRGEDVMPAGIAADVPYFVKPAGKDTFELYRTIDPATGALSGKVAFGPGARGSFAIALSSIATDVEIGSGNVFIATNSGSSILRDIRGARVSGRFTGRMRMGGLADCSVAATFTDSVVVLDAGGTDRLAFTNADFTSRFPQKAGDATMVRAAFGDTAHYDVSFESVTVQARLADLAPGRPASFFSESPTTNPRLRKGPGWSARNCIVSVDAAGRPFEAFAAPVANRAAYSGNKVPA